jgi:hypothetical protein
MLYARCRGFLETQWTQKRLGLKALIEAKFANQTFGKKMNG